MRNDVNPRRQLAALLVVLTLAATACTGSATVTETGSSTGDAGEPTSAARPTTPPDEPTAVPNEPTAVPVEPTAVAVEPTAVPVPALAIEDFRTDNIVAISNSGLYGYAGTTSPWNTPTPCDASAHESLAGIDIEAADQGDVAPFGAGLEQAGDVRQMLVSQGTRVAILSSCGAPEAPMLWLQSAEVTDDGRLGAIGEPLAMGGEGERDPYLLSWVDPATIELRVIIEVDPDDAGTWIVERRQMSMVTGEVLFAEQFDFFEDDGFRASPVLTTAKGFTYRVVDDPAGSLGCEGFGVARTIELDDGNERRLALTQPDLVASSVDELHIGSTGYIAWTSGCEGFVSAYVGKVTADGMIADAHLIETFGLDVGLDGYAEFQHYRLTNDGFLAAVGLRYDNDTGDSSLAVLRYDLSLDPNFVNTADPAPVVDPAPLFDAVGGNGSWHVGETLAADAACGSMTLYGQTPGGLVRAFPAGVELDAIVDADVGETRTIDYDDGSQFVSRTVVVQTECPAEYEGRRVWFGTETDVVVWGLGFQQADLVEVADVLSVRDVVQPGTQYVESSFIEIEYLDGSIVEVELVALPFDG